jgi:hypothetical protein
MSSTAFFQVDPRLASLLSEQYRSSEQALKELVDNAWDADADHVCITLPEAMSGDEIVVEDDGVGMTDSEVKEEYLKVGRDRRLKGEFTTVKRRRVKGHKGVGKFAGLVVADEMTVTTRARNTVTTLTIPRKQLREAVAQDLERVELPLSTTESAPNAKGTTVSLRELNQRLSFPQVDRLKQLLILEYGREPDFSITVNGELVGLIHVPGEAHTESASLPAVGNIKLFFKVTDPKHPIRNSGIAIRVVGKIVGNPTVFGLNDDEEIPKGMLRRVYGEVEADGLYSDVTAGWNAIIETSKAYQELEKFVSSILKAKLRETFKREFALHKGRLKQEIDRRLSKMPEHRRAYARKLIERVITKLYEDKQERIEPVVSVLLDALERDEYWYVLKKLDEAPHSDVQVLADTLEDFGIVEVAMIGRQAQVRLKYLDHLQSLYDNPKTLEIQMHRAIEQSLWVLGADLDKLSSNQSLRSVVENCTKKRFAKKSANKRPDLVLVSGADGRHVLIEFKRPSHTIKREDQAQAESYRDDLTPTFGTKMDVVLVGKDVDKALLLHQTPGVRFLSYAGAISKARTELSWLLENLVASRTKSAQA